MFTIEIGVRQAQSAVNGISLKIIIGMGNKMNKRQLTYDAIYLSPHLDDVALSCAGQVWRRTAVGERVLIVTMMAGDPPDSPLSPFAQLLHDRWALAADAVAARRAEDIAACQIMGAEWRHGPAPDCVYRRDPQSGEPLYPTVDSIFAAVHPAEEALRAALSRWLSQLPPAKAWYLPLTVGAHVDHQLTRQAAEETANRPPCYYYEDYPYAQKAGALALALGETETWGVKTVELTETAVQIRFQAAAAFVSQVSTFFSDQADLERQIGDYIERVGGERYYWKMGE
jgi:LmbE family N-acetylglucosaminyl deacetylase